MKISLQNDGKEHVVLLDDQDEDLLADMRLFRNKQTYFVGRREGGHWVQLHRCVAGRMADQELTSYQMVKFLNGNPLDCRRENLRIKGMKIMPSKNTPSSSGNAVSSSSERVVVRWRLSRDSVKKIRLAALEKDMPVNKYIESLVA